MTHLDRDCRDFRSGDRVASDMATWGDITCPTCRAAARRLL